MSSPAGVSARGKSDGFPATSTSIEKVFLITYPEWLERKREVEERLKLVSVAPEIKRPKSKSNTAIASKKRTRGESPTIQQQEQIHIPYTPKSDVHWDFVAKEMMWLGADFKAERKRQISLAKKLAFSVQKYHETKEKRRVRQLQQAELKRKKLAAKIGRDVKGWWSKLDKIVAYKQKRNSDEERQMAMNKQLVALVRQTEKYTESISTNKVANNNRGRNKIRRVSAEEEDEDSDNDGSTKKNRCRKQGRRHERDQSTTTMTIEEALASSSKRRKTKSRVVDYARMKLEDTEFYGESTADEQSIDNGGVSSDNDDDSYSPSSSDDRYNDNTAMDDESTLRIAMREEMKARRKKKKRNVDNSRSSYNSSRLRRESDDDQDLDLVELYSADPKELRKLYEEQYMELNQVLERLQKESYDDNEDEDNNCLFITEAEENEGDSIIYDASLPRRSKNVHYAQVGDGETTILDCSENTAKNYSAQDDSGDDADDDGDASDVEDYHDMSAEIDDSVTTNNDNTCSYSNTTMRKDEGDDSDAFFQDCEPQPDDETTMIQEESLPKEISAEEEIDILKKSAEIPIKELLKIYNGRASLQLEEVDNSYDEYNGRVAEIGSTDSNSNCNDDDDDDDDDDEFQASNKQEVDDETTLEVEEQLGRDITYEEELNMLNRENEMPIEQLRAMYTGMNNCTEDDSDDSLSNGRGREEESNIDDANNIGSVRIVKGAREDQSVNANDVSEDDDDEYEVLGEQEVDDETTMEAEEKLNRDMTYEEELDVLKIENEIPIEELKAMYADIGNESNPEETDIDLGESEQKKDENHSNCVQKDLKTKELAVEGETKEKRDRDELTSDSPLQRRPKRGRHKRVIPDKSEFDDGAAALDALEKSASKARQTLASRPFLLSPWVKLRKYQQVGLNWLVSLQSRRLNGILADEMGLGKTLQTISLLAYLASYKGIWGPHLVIVPTSVIINWETELKRFCPGFKVLCYYGSAKRRKELRMGWTKANWYHVVITSYQLAVQDAFAFKRKKWYYLILDEAQNIKNFQSQRWQTLINFNTQRRLLLTGTPLQNSLMELWSLLHFLMPYIFKSRKEFSYWFSNPMNNIIEGTTNRNDDVIKRLHGIIRPFVLRRLKKDVETQMPGKFEHIVKCQLSRRQMTLYEEFLSRSSTRQALKKGGNFLGMMSVLMQLRKVCNHPDLFEPRSIITPFILPSIDIFVPRCVCDVEPREFNISKTIIYPLWCGSSGLPSTRAAFRHNQTEADVLKSICGKYKPQNFLEFDDNGNCPTELQTLIKEVYQARKDKQASRVQFNNTLNLRRCRASPFPYPLQLLNSVEIECNIFGRTEPVEIKQRKVIETPIELIKLRRTEIERASAMEQIIEKFVFRVPPAGGRAPKLDNGVLKENEQTIFSKDVKELLLRPLERIVEPYRKARARLSSFFPDKKLVQYDAGKLQTLAKLLRKLKEGGHRCLIFTQMSKVLDILEAFLSMNGHTYLRLDGATGIDRRQRYMDRFNNDTKIFCFILSTRSGGMGINLTGADTVIFYDSDWNPAMDAQAQDRAHRIGQTRDVHIYRLITEHSIEENILTKAQKKKHLDLLIMDQGRFDASEPPQQEDISSRSDDTEDVYTKKGLQAILGVGQDESDTDDQSPPDMSKEQLEKAMASLEDEDDVKALRGAQQEAVEDSKEFDENTSVFTEDDNKLEKGEERENTPKKPIKKAKKQLNTDNAETKRDGKEKNADEEELEKEFAAWQSTKGFDEKVLEQSLSPMEKYGLSFREDIDPFYSIFYINEQRRKMEVIDGTEEIDIEEVERQKAIEEQQAIDNEDLLATGIRPEDLVRQRNFYRREKARLRSEKIRKKITGEFWSQKVDGVSKKLFWYNDETGEATWVTPLVVLKLQEEENANRSGWSHLPINPMFQIMQYLLPLPERQVCSAVCRQWRLASTDGRFVLHVYPVEMRAFSNREPSKRHYNHYASIEDALSIALPGDTIELADGHYWVNHPGIRIDKPIKFIGDENNPANVVVEMSGSVQWSAKCGWIEGITFRRPKIARSGILPPFPMIELMEYGKLDMVCSVFDNDGSAGPVAILIKPGNKGIWRKILFRNGGSSGIEIEGEAVSVQLIECTVKGCKGDGLKVSKKAKFELINCSIESNQGCGVRLKSEGCQAKLYGSLFKDNIGGIIKKEPHCFVTSSSNTAFVRYTPEKQIPGFKIIVQDQKAS